MTLDPCHTLRQLSNPRCQPRIQLANLVSHPVTTVQPQRKYSNHPRHNSANTTQPLHGQRR